MIVGYANYNNNNLITVFDDSQLYQMIIYPLFQTPLSYIKEIQWSPSYAATHGA